MTKIKSLTIDAIGAGWMLASVGLLGIGIGFDNAGAVLFAMGTLFMGVGLLGVFALGVAKLAEV